MNRQKRYGTLVALACISAASTTTFAANDVLEEIVVTATRQEQSLSKVPLSIVATNQEALDKLGVRSAEDLMRLTPSVSFGQGGQYYGTGQTQISVRGVASSSGVPTTGVYIDDTPIQSRTGISPSLGNAYPKIFDLDRVEVLRGPQGTLFGTGSMGGAVRFITPDPVYGTPSLYARSELSTTKNGATSYEMGLAGGTPVVEDVVGFRGSFWHQKEGGYLDRLDRTTGEVIQPDINSEISNVGRIAIGWKATDILTITPSVFFQQVNIADTSLLELATSDVRRNDFRTSMYAIPQPHKDKFWLPAIKVEAKFDTVSLISNTSYFTRNTSTVSDDTALNVALWSGNPNGLKNPQYFFTGSTIPAQFVNNRANTQNHTSQKGWTQEVRLQSSDPNQRFNWVVGAFYSNSTVSDAFDAANPDLLAMINSTLPSNLAYATVTDALGSELYQGQYVVSQRTRYKDVQKSIFAQADFEVVPSLKLTAGLRYTDATLNYHSFVVGPLYATDVGFSSELKPTSKDVTPKFGVSYQVNDNNLVYVNAAKGVRGATVADPVGNSCDADAATLGFDSTQLRKIKSDSLWSYEAGSKNKLWDGRLAIDASVYREKWTDLQTNILLPSCQVFTTFNLGNAQIDGVDFSVMTVPVDGLTLGAEVSYMDARYSSALVVNGFEIRRRGEPLDVAPWTMHFSSEYRFTVNEHDIYARADYTHTTHNSTPIDVNSPLVDPAIPRAPATSSLDLRTGVRFAGVDISLFANNMLNAHPLLSIGHDAPGNFFRSTTYRPRTIGITVSYKK